IGFVDIGARGGTHPIMDPLAGVTAVLAFDPDPEEGRAIRAAQARAPRWVRVEVEAAASPPGPGRRSCIWRRPP
ncbi:MAG: hypothetical protein ACK5YI_16480, partial [Rhodospirillales bacterium]